MLPLDSTVFLREMQLLTLFQEKSFNKILLTIF